MSVIPLPIIIENGGKYIAAWCPVLDIATQGRTEEETRKNMKELIDWYFEDNDTPKPELKAMMNMSVSITNIPVSVSKGAKHKHETACAVSPKNN